MTPKLSMPVTNQEDTTMTPEQRSKLLELLWGSMEQSAPYPDRVITGWGTKTQNGLIACISSIMKDDGDKDTQHFHIEDTDTNG